MLKKTKEIISKLCVPVMVVSAFSLYQNPINSVLASTNSSLFSDNFEDGNAAGWKKEKGSWTVAKDGSNYVYRKSGTGEGRVSTGDTKWTDYSVEGEITPVNFNGKSVAMLCGRYVDKNNYYAVAISSANGGTIDIRKKVAGKNKVLKSVSLPISNNTSYNVKLSMNGSTLNAYVNGKLEVSVSDTSFTSGEIALDSNKAQVEYDDIVVYGSEAPAPTPISYSTPTLTASTTSEGASSVTVTIENFGTAPIKQYKIDNGTWQDYTSPVVVSKNCTVYAEGSDAAGNKSQVSSLAISNIGQVPAPTPTGDVITVTNFDQLKAAAAVATSGQIIQIASNYLDCTSQLVLDKDNSGVTIEAAPGYTPVLDFTSFRTKAQAASPTKTGDGYTGIRIIGGNYTIQGLIIEKAYDNGILIKPNFNPANPKATNVGNPDNNTIKDCVLRYNGDAGLQISGSQGLEKAGLDVRPDNTHVIGCTAYRNFDTLTTGGNADGFAAKLYLGKGTVFSHCVSAENSDDAWDSFGVGSSDITYEYCVAYHSGDSTVFSGDYDKAHNLPVDNDMTVGKCSGNGNGFKMGSGSSKYGAQTNGIRSLTNCVAVDNCSKGFDENNGSGTINITNGMGLGNVKGDYVLDLMTAGTFSNVQAFALKGLKNPSGASVSIINDEAQKAAVRSEVDTAITKMRQELRENKIPSYMNFSFWK